jgi:hypothetical protein
MQWMLGFQASKMALVASRINFLDVNLTYKSEEEVMDPSNAIKI